MLRSSRGVLLRDLPPGASPGRSPPRVEAGLGPVLEFMKLLWAVDHGLQSASRRIRATMGVTGPQRLVVRLIGRFPSVTAGQLARLLHLHPSTLTGILQRLEAGSLIRRESDPADARRARFVLTPKGEKVDQRLAGTVEAAVRNILNVAPASQLAAARTLLVRLAAELEG